MRGRIADNAKPKRNQRPQIIGSRPQPLDEVGQLYEFVFVECVGCKSADLAADITHGLAQSSAALGKILGRPRQPLQFGVQLFTHVDDDV